MNIVSARKTFLNLFVFIQGLLFCSGSLLAQPVADFSATPASGCSPFLVQFQDLSSGNPTSWKWDLGNGTTSFEQNPSTTYFDPGQYKVTLIAGNAAGQNTIVKDQFITVHFAPTIDFIADPISGCYPLPVQFTDQSIAGSGTLIEWLWDFGDGTTGSGQNPQHIYTASGTYGVTLTAKNDFGCTNSLFKSQYINIVEGVTADFDNDLQNTCKAPVTLNFQNFSTGSSSITYQWDFGDGSGSTVTNPSHLYSTSGTFVVKLIATNATGCIDVIEKEITIGSVNADFTTPASVCPGGTFAITNTSTPVPGSVFWDFGDGTTSNLIDPQKIYDSAGSYSISMIANFGACLDTVIKPITVLDKQIFSFTVDDSLACQAPHTANFTSNAPGASAYNWDFGDGSTSTDANPSHTYDSSGIFDVTLVVLNASGCNDTLIIPKFIRIQGAEVTLESLPLEDCLPFTHTFSANIDALDSIVTYNWDFGDGTTSNLASPTHTFTVLGSYTITLSVTSTGGCISTAIVPNGVKVGNKPIVNFSADPRDLCANAGVNFTDLSTGNVDQWLWKFGDGTTSTDQNPVHFYQDTGLFTVTLVARSSGCPDSVSFFKYINIKPAVANFGVGINCRSPLQRIFTDSSKGADSWQWDFGDGNTSSLQNPVHTYTDTGTFTVTLRVTNLSTGCDHTVTETIRVINPIVDFVASDTDICKNTSIIFSTPNIIATDISNYTWNFGDAILRSVQTGSVSHKYTKSGTFNVKLTITDVFGCKDSLTIPQYIKADGPSSFFSSAVTGTCVNNSVVFIDSSKSDGTASITQWIWNYGDSTIETLSAPPYQHSYSKPGIYTVSLTTIDVNGCIDSLVKPFYIVITQPVADFSTQDTSSCPSKLVRFTNLSKGNNLVYSWNFGDGTTSATPNPAHTYSATGTYTITLKITDQYGCIDSVTKQNYINISLPVANFSLTDSVSDCPPFVVTFTSSSVNYTSLFWDFGDGNTSSIDTPTHTYFLPGTYTVILRATGPGGCFDEKFATIIVNGPTGVFNYTNIAGCNTLQTSFKASAKKNIIFTWDFNDGVTVITPDSIISHIYTNPGFYLPKLILEDDKGCKVPITGADTIKVYQVQANFSAFIRTICDAGSVDFIDSSTSNDIIAGYFWDFGDGATSIQQNPSHVYNSPGLYDVRLVIITQTGCRDTAQYNAYVKVIASPNINILANASACEFADVIFRGNFLQPDTSVVTWQWDLGNGQISSQQNPAPQQYITAGTYNITAVATNSSGCKDTARHSIIINPLPPTNAGDDAFLCLGTPLQLQASGANTYQWLTPTNNLSCTSCAAPVTTTPNDITYVVKGISSFGCEKTDSINIRVKRPFTVVITPDSDSVCRGQQIQLNASGAENYLWTPSSTLNSSTIQNPFASPDTNTIYKVVGFDSANCFRDSALVSISVFPFPLVNAGVDQTIKTGVSVLLSPTFSNDVIKWLWTPTDGLNCDTCPAPVAMPNATTTYTLRVENNGGCSVTDNVTIIVICNNENVFIPNTFSPNGDGANDVFYVRGSGLFAIKNLRILNRWGEVIFERSNVNANDISQGWDGTYKGEMLLPDVFVYTADVVCNNNTTLTYSGNVTLIR